MFPSPFKVVLDACVLFPMPLCDTLLRAAAAGFYQMCWTQEILDEACRNLVATGRATQQQADNRYAAIRDEFEESLVTDYTSLVSGMQNDPKDRHVVAAAVRCGAQVIVTANLTDFVPLPEGIDARSPDDFLCDLLDLNPPLMHQIIHEQAQALKKPPMSVQELLARLEKMAPTFCAEIRKLEKA